MDTIDDINITKTENVTHIINSNHNNSHQIIENDEEISHLNK